MLTFTHRSLKRFIDDIIDFTGICTTTRLDFGVTTIHPYPRIWSKCEFTIPLFYF